MPSTDRPDLLVVSTHLDDAVLSCATTIASTLHAVVATVFTDAPDVERRDGWNHATTGEAWAPDSQRVRRDEDAAALAALGATAIWLGEFEAEYRPAGQDVAALAERIATCVGDVDAREVWVPLGLHHADHLAVADACRRVIAEDTAGTRAWRLYVDLPYARTYPDEVDARAAALVAAGFTLDDHRARPVNGTLKQAAVECYPTQLDGVRGEHPEFDRALADPEQSWRITHASGADANGSPSTVT